MKGYFLDSGINILKILKDWDGDFYFLAFREGYCDKYEGRARLYECLEEYDFFDYEPTEEFSYEIMDKLSLLSDSDYLIIKSLNQITTDAFALMSDYQDEDIVGMSSSPAPLYKISLKLLNIAKPAALKESLSEINSSSEFLFLFHTLHIDINLVLGVFEKNSKIPSIIKSLDLELDFKSDTGYKTLT